MIRLSKKYTRSQSGSAAIEFAFVAPLFFGFLFSMFEIGLLLLRSSTLDRAVAEAASLVYTGQAPTKEALEKVICETVALSENCEANINVEITLLDNYTDVPNDRVGCRDSSNAGFEPATRYADVPSAQIAFIRVCLTSKIITPGVGFGLSLPKTGTGRYEMIASTAFLSEPF